MHHPEYVHNGFLILALIFFLFDGLHLFATPRLSWTILGYAAVVAAFLFPFFV